MRTAIWLSAVASGLLAMPAWALVLDGSGHVTDWGIAPLTHSVQADVTTATGYATYANNYAPINYPSVGWSPSGGEAFDLEEMHVRFTGSQMQVLLVTSFGYQQPYGGDIYRLGDLFVTVGSQQYGIVTQTANQGLVAGAVYEIEHPTDVRLLQSGSATYAGNPTLVQNAYGPSATVEQIAGPWAVKGSIPASQLLGSAGIQTGWHNYAGEPSTFLIEYTFDTTMFGPIAPGAFNVHQTVGCGNDVIEVNGNIPEPASAGLITALGLGMLWRRRRAA